MCYELNSVPAAEDFIGFQRFHKDFIRKKCRSWISLLL